MNEQKTTLRQLFFAFFRIGLFTFGGGYAMLPMMEREIVEKNAWATNDELLNYFAVSQCTPGIIAVNTATFIGYNQRGALGAAAATAGVVCPSLIIIVAIAALLKSFSHITAVQHAFVGIRAAVAALIGAAVIKLFKNNVLAKKNDEDRRPALRRSGVAIALCVMAFVIVAFFNASPVIVIVGATLAGLILGARRKSV